MQFLRRVWYWVLWNTVDVSGVACVGRVPTITESLQFLNWLKRDLERGKCTTCGRVLYGWRKGPRECSFRCYVERKEAKRAGQ